MGLLRLFLALSVISGHAQSTVFGFNGIGAWYAVNFFFIISGFYMAMVLNEKYKDISVFSFYKSRLLRLFPAYYIGLIIAAAVSFDAIAILYNNLSSGGKFYFAFQNLFIFGQDLSYLACIDTLSPECASPVQMTINPPAWSLAVELGFYLVAPFILKSQKKTFLFVIFGCIYLLTLNKIHFPVNYADLLRALDIHQLNYYFYPSSFPFFGGGALAYHLSKRNSEPHYFLAILTIVLLSFTQTIMPFWHLLFISMAIPVLFNYTANNRLDRTIGELSYPTYIMHFPLLLFVQPFVQTHPEYFKHITLGTWVALLSCSLGFFVYYFIERFIGKHRQPKKSKNISTSPSMARKLLLPAILAYFCFPIALVCYVFISKHYANFHYDNSAYNLTDTNWLNGVGRSSPSFFVPANKNNLSSFLVGKHIKFSNGDVRLIIDIKTSREFINVYLDGPMLDGNRIGYPNRLEIVDKK